MNPVTAIINFYETNAPYGCFSNFAKYPLNYEGRVWPTSEHCFQAAKFTEQADIDAVHQASTAFAAARIGRERGRSLRPDWDAVRDSIMLSILEAKFTQHESLGSVLASTRGARLVEHTANDNYWGDGGDGSGRNRLGELLEQLRERLFPEQEKIVLPPWIALPEFDPFDLFWRMGPGEEYLSNVFKFRNGLSAAARTEYDTYYPAPPEWKPWVVDADLHGARHSGID